MNAIGGHHAVEGYGGGLCVRDRLHRNPTNGRQGKRPAFGAPYVVGRIEQFTTPTRCLAGAGGDLSKQLNAPTAVAPPPCPEFGHDDAR